ncbi:hypothetical protein DPMN_008348 [Dreissena polymorpha]|uniref:Uncharacterized protein n=1 Tax=Dreissena polymorpha TaxID=45954 RepID=A0A9D4RZ23_DREPO|nr:hypothetical protein DPMN_008348 [Dreissena polymorpha]
MGISLARVPQSSTDGVNVTVTSTPIRFNRTPVSFRTIPDQERRRKSAYTKGRDGGGSA